MTTTKEKDTDDDVFIIIPCKSLINLMNMHYNRAGAISTFLSRNFSNNRAIGNAISKLLLDFGRNTITRSELDKVRKNVKEIKRKA